MRFLTVILIFTGLLFVGCDDRAFSQIPDKQKPDFRTLVEQKLAKEYKIKKIINGRTVEEGVRLADVCPVDTNKTAQRIFTEYGAIFIAVTEVTLPPRCIFSDEEQVQKFQTNANPKTVLINGVAITLQAPAMDALQEAIKKAAQSRARISPRGGQLAAKRSYENTRTLWNTRFLPGLNYWVRRRTLSLSDAETAKWLSTEAQVEQVLDWENNRRLYFSKDFTKSILYSVAAPGASQHISMLAIDVEQFADKRVRDILAEFGWFQTVKSDLPHFTYLGRKESELPAWGLKKVTISGQDFWIPDFE